VISDIDDTIKVSEVRSKEALLANTFLREYRAVEGMAPAYRPWAAAGAVFHYCSASPWQLYEFLAEFLERTGYPAGTVHLKTFRVKDTSFFNLFASPEEYKRGVIEPILETFPRRRFLLVGDSGEKDPEIYATLARKYPKQVAGILIRDVTDERADAERYRKCFEGLPRERWHIFTDPKELERVTQDLGLFQRP
jgi:phosphatidate phosphatase APP1